MTNSAVSTTFSVSDMTSDDFDLFWKWLTNNRSSKIVKEKAENVHIRRVFLTLGFFKTELEIVEFMRTWECEDEYTVTAPELRVGLTKLLPSHFQVFYRFLAALRKRDDEERVKEREHQKRLELKRKKREQQKKAREKRLEKSNSRQYFGQRFLKPSLKRNLDECSEGSDADRSELEADDIRAFKAKYGLDQTKKKKSITKLFMSFIRSFSGDSASSRRILAMNSDEDASVSYRANNSIQRSVDIRSGDVNGETSYSDRQHVPSEIKDSLVSFASSFIESEFVSTFEPC